MLWNFPSNVCLVLSLKNFHVLDWSKNPSCWSFASFVGGVGVVTRSSRLGALSHSFRGTGVQNPTEPLALKLRCLKPINYNLKSTPRYSPSLGVFSRRIQDFQQLLWCDTCQFTSLLWATYLTSISVYCQIRFWPQEHQDSLTRL